MTPRELAEYLKVDRKSVLYWRNREYGNQLSMHKLGSRFVIDSEDAVDFISKEIAEHQAEIDRLQSAIKKIKARSLEVAE